MLRPFLACFDVFDTVLLRAVAVPSDVFRLVYSDLASKLPHAFAGWGEDAFIAARLQAERSALAECGYEECTLSEVWAKLSESIVGVKGSYGLSVELKVEEAVLRLNDDVAREIRATRSTGADVAFLTDTPLPKRFVAGQLQRFDVLRPDDQLYVSSDLRITKRSGRLYGAILHRNKVKPSKTSMLGDNLTSDVRVPRRLGIRARHYSRSQPSTLEGSVASLPQLSQRARSALSSQIRIERLNAKPCSAGTELLATYLGSACLAWAMWVLLRAQSSGIERLYFVSRDAFLVWRCAAVISRAFGIECRYLMISRQAVLAAGTDNVSGDGLRWLITAWEKPTYALICRRLEVDINRCGRRLRTAIEARGLQTPLSNDDLTNFWEALKEDETQTYLLGIFRAKRNNALGFLEQEGLLLDSRWALVDLGWHLSVQRAISQLIFPVSVAGGFYVYISDQRPGPTVVGRAEAMFPLVPPDTEPRKFAPTVARFATASEHIFGIANHGTVLGYKKEGSVWRPECQPERNEQAVRRSTIIEGIEAFAARNATLFLDTLKDAAECAAVFECISRKLLLQPPVDVARTLGEASTASSDHINVGGKPLARSLRNLEGMRLMLPARFWGDVSAASPWLEGCVRLSPLYLQVAWHIRRQLPQLLSAVLPKV
jgi:FMN phosphatase YigB (HAD superfamily)